MHTHHLIGCVSSREDQKLNTWTSCGNPHLATSVAVDDQSHVTFLLLVSLFMYFCY